MPELPEVETIARQLDQVLPDRTISKVEVLREKSARTDLSPLEGKSIKKVSRKAKTIVISFDGEDQLLLIHLKMTGQLIFQETVDWSQESAKSRIVGGHPTADWVRELPSKHTRIIIRFEDGSILYFNDMRVFGWMKLVDSSQWSGVSSKMPPDVVDEAFTVEYLTQSLERSSRAVKLVILDQAKIGGMGNIYANDALWLAGIDPQKPANQLTRVEVDQLHGAMVRVIRRGIELGGASENTYKHVDGLGGSYQDEFLVYKRAGLVCGKDGCAEIIDKIKIGGRGTFYCVRCQK
jgi:formamidopyrimidine-DNA glycosylase